MEDNLIIIFGLGFSFIMGWLCSLEYASIKRKTKYPRINHFILPPARFFLCGKKTLFLIFC